MKDQIYIGSKSGLKPKFKFKKIHIRTEADMDKLWATYGMDCYHLGDKGIILVDHRKRKEQ